MSACNPGSDSLSKSFSLVLVTQALPLGLGCP